jgi:DNA-binding XRE family transcriptional regulator
MKTHTEHQIVVHNGIPVAAVIPYAEYLALIDRATDSAEESEDPLLSDADIEEAIQDNQTIPHEVMGFIVNKKISPIRAWREHLGLTQAAVAARMGVNQATYARMESGKSLPRVATIKNIAQALGIRYSQLNWW